MRSHPDLEGQVAVVTGGSSGIGRATVRYLARTGVDVAFCYVGDPAAAELTVAGVTDETAGQEPPGRVVAVEADVSDEAAVERFFAVVDRELGPPRLLVNNAGILNVEPIHRLSSAGWSDVIGVNLLGHVLCTRAAVRSMIESGTGGAIVNTGSVLGRWSLPGRSAYSASKAAIGALTRTWALELGRHGIRVNTVEPGTIETEMMAELPMSAAERSAAEATIPLGRFGRPVDVAKAVTFLLSDAAAYVTGTTLVVDGGLSESPDSRGASSWAPKSLLDPLA